MKLTFSVVWIKADGSAAAHKQLAAGSAQPEAVQSRPKKRRCSAYIDHCLTLFIVSTRTTSNYYLEKAVPQMPSLPLMLSSFPH